MSEKLNAPKIESVPQHESIERAKAHLESLKAKAEIDAKEHTSTEHLQKAVKAVESQAISGKEISPAELFKDIRPSAGYVNRELKDMAFKRSLRTARRQMNAPSRMMSKIIHQPVVEKVSEVAGATVARPSGILGGGLFAFVGSFALLCITKHYGYTYNYLVFSMLFVGGFAVGMITELVLGNLLGRRHKRR